MESSQLVSISRQPVRSVTYLSDRLLALQDELDEHPDHFIHHFRQPKFSLLGMLGSDAAKRFHKHYADGRFYVGDEDIEVHEFRTLAQLEFKGIPYRVGTGLKPNGSPRIHHVYGAILHPIVVSVDGNQWKLQYGEQHHPMPMRMHQYIGNQVRSALGSAPIHF